MTNQMTDDALASLLDGFPLPVIVLDADGKITRFNAAAQEIFGSAIVDLNATTLLRQAPVLDAMDRALRNRSRAEADFVLSGQSGDRTYHFVAAPLEPSGGALLSFEDRSAAAESDAIRRAFIANISHELRTPLTGLRGFIETLRTTARNDPEARDRFLEIMEGEADRMGRMVSDLLSLSRVEADERVRPRDKVDIAGVLRSTVATLEGKLKDGRVRVDLTLEEEKCLLLGDRDQLIQLFLNLIENAIKYAGADTTIFISLTKVEKDPALRQKAIRIDVRDEGPGIDPLHLPRLTERFYRIDDHRNRGEGGTGLGLAIVKHIMNRHRGRLKITSKQGVGSVFSTIFPDEISS